MRTLRTKLTFANVISVIALFIALGGASYAAFKLPKNSVGPKQIRNGAVSEGKLSASAKAALKGAKGDQGPPGPGATSFATTLTQGTNFTDIVTASNGLTVQGSCLTGPSSVGLKIKTTGATNTLDLSGTVNNGAFTTSPEDVDNIAGAAQSADPSTIDFDVIARDRNVGPFARLDIHGHFGSPCTYWGMITPSA
jgi:hypothetical protein